MTQSCQEQHPLLHEDLSEVEHCRPQRRGRLVPTRSIRSRVRNKVNGAASIFRLWPGYWSTALTYLWIALGMIAFITLLIYNGINVVALIPTERDGVPIIHILNESIEKSPTLPDIFMHIHVKLDEPIDFNKYSIDINFLRNQYKDYVYHLVIIIDNVYTQIDHELDDEEIKYSEFEIHTVLDYIAAIDQQKIVLNGVEVEQILLTEYLDASPLKDHWRKIPFNLIEFLVRAVSIWERGGIVFNPIILTPYTPHPFYIEKLHAILDSYRNDNSKNEALISKQVSFKDNRKPRKLNNIRDIIDAMEHNNFDQNEIEEEDIKLTSLESAESRFLTPMIVNLLNDTKEVINKMSTSFLYNKDHKKLNNTKKNIYQQSEVYNSQEYDMNRVNKISETNTTSNTKVLPVVMRYLLNSTKINKNDTVTNVTRKRKSVIKQNEMSQYRKENMSMDGKIINDTDKNYKPMIVSANITGMLKTARYKINTDIDKNMFQDQDKLIVDLHGNILATKTSCHAFIGTLFSNVVHHVPNENITEFIIRELSIFCKGLLSSCNGIDIIFL